MYCKLCGKEIDDDSKFCRYCGAELSEIEAIVEKSKSNGGEIFTDEEPECIISDNTAIINECDKTNNENTKDSMDKEVPHNSKIMNALGILSGIVLYGLLGIFGLAFFALSLFFIYFLIMTWMPNGKGKSIFIIILAVVVYFVVKGVLKIFKSMRK